MFDDDPGMPWLTLAMACRRAHGRATCAAPTTGSRLDPGHVALDRALRRARSAGADVMAAIDACHASTCALVDLFHRVPLLLTPDRRRPAGARRRAGHHRRRADADWVSFTYPFNMTRSPAGTVCAGFTTDGMPVGLQVVGPQHADVVVLRALALLEDALAIDRVATGVVECGRWLRFPIPPGAYSSAG